MAKILSTETSPYINKQIEIYSKNKVGQYSKYLQKNPIFVTYYSINQPMSRANIGLAGIDDEVGANSPIKFNKVIDFPVYGMPELKPDVEYDETGMDVTLDLSDIIILPNTIKPKESDYLKVVLPATNTQFLFRVTGFEFNTVQSNDFFTITLDIKKTGHMDDENINAIEKQVVETYRCIFENIGTEDKCFIRTDDEAKLRKLGSFILELRRYYKNLFYNKDTGDFTVSTLGTCTPKTYYDVYVTRFINESNIFYEMGGDTTNVFPYNENIPFNFDYLFSESLYEAVLKRSVSFLKPYSYYMPVPSTKRFSPYSIQNITCEVPNLYMLDTPFKEDGTALEDGGFKEYFSHGLLNMIITGIYPEETPPTDPPVVEETYKPSYFDKIIFDYMKGNVIDIDYNKILDTTYECSIKNYIYIPLIIYILEKTYDNFFYKETI